MKVVVGKFAKLRFDAAMKMFLPLCVSAFFLVGCRSNYDVTLSNGTRFTGVSKPRFDKKTGKYFFKTPDGREGSFYPANIKLIQPHQESYAPTFNASQKK